MVGGVWWKFLRINEDGWSSGFQSVDLVLKHLGRKSRSVASRKSYCYILWLICSKVKVDPEKLILRARENPDAVARLIQDLADEYNSRRSTRYANHIIHLAKTFFQVNKVELDLHSYFQPTRSRKRPEYVPTLSEALKMADVAGSLRDRLIILFLTYTGLRNSTLTALVYNEVYPDPLLQEHTIRKELESGEECLIIIIHEVMKRRVPNACKNRMFYYTFIPTKVTECLGLYLRSREERYGFILDDEPIFITKNRRISLSERRRTPISSRELQEIVKKTAKRAGIKNWRYVYPHCLRKTYESFLRNQPDDVRLDIKEREFLFGHTLPGSQDTYFDKTKIEETRVKYAKMIFEPATGIEEEERVISEDELQAFLQQGWRFEATLPSGKVVVSRKTVTKRPEESKTISNAKVTSNVSDQKEKSQEGSKSLMTGLLPLSVHPVSPNQPIQHINNDNNRVLNERKRWLGLEKWIGLHKTENSPHNLQAMPYFSSEISVKEKKNIVQNSATKTKQKSLLSFI